MGRPVRVRPVDALAALSRSVHFDWVLAPYDLAASRAHAGVLHRAGPARRRRARLAARWARRRSRPTCARARSSPNDDDEDVHTALERGLIERVRRRSAASCAPDAAATTRSRPTCGCTCASTRGSSPRRSVELQAALLDQAEAHVDTLRRASRTCSTRSRCRSATSSPSTFTPSRATSTGCGTGTTGPRSRRWAPARLPGRRCRSTRRRPPPSSASRAPIAELDRRRQRPRLRRRVPVRRGADRRRTCRGWARSSACGPRASSAGCASTTRTRPVRRSCRRRRIPTSPSWRAARRAG